MNEKEAIIRYAMEHGELDDLKIMLLNQSDSIMIHGDKNVCIIIAKNDVVERYFKEHKQNIKFTVNNKNFSVSAKDAAFILEQMFPMEFSKSDLKNLYFSLSKEVQDKLFPLVFSFYPKAICTRTEAASADIVDAVKRGYNIQLNEKHYAILSDDDLAECLFLNDWIMRAMPEERWNKNLAERFSRKLAETGTYYDCIQVPENCQSRTYWENLCKADGYYYRILPEKYRDILSEKLILYTLRNAKSFVSSWHLFETIPDELKTAKVSLLCCLKHFAAIQCLPKRFQVDRFYQILSDHGQNSFLNEINLKTMSKELLMVCIDRFKGDFNGKIPNEYWDEKLAVRVAEHICDLNIIPRKWQSKEVYKAFLRKHGQELDQISESKIDEELCLVAMESNSYAAIRMIPEKCKTDAFWKEIIRKQTFSKIKDLPEEYQKQAWSPEKCRDLADIPDELLDEEHILSYLCYLKKINETILPSELTFQTQKICDEVIGNCNSSDRKLWFMKSIRPEFRRSVDKEEVLRNCKDSIFLDGLTRDEIQLNLKYFPENILFVPDGYEEPSIPEKLYKEGYQFNLFDFIN